MISTEDRVTRKSVLRYHARQMDSCYGARMTGAGFGGCAVALVRSPDVESFAISVADCYERATSIRPDVSVWRAGCGATLLSPPEIAGLIAAAAAASTDLSHRFRRPVR